MDQKFFDDYIKHFSVSPLTRQTNLAILKLKNLKTEKGKNDYAIILYSSYLQLIENFIMFMLVVLDDKHLENLFELQPRVIAERYEKLFGIEEGKVSLLGKEKLRNIIQGSFPNVFTDDITRDYAKFFIESLEDFVQDKGFLNSFKHGLRAHSIGKTSIKMRLSGGTQEFSMGEFNSSIRYYSKEKYGKGNVLIYENTITFNYEYVHAKIIFLENFLENLKKRLSTKKKSFIVRYFHSPGEELLLKHGIYRFNKPIFEEHK